MANVRQTKQILIASSTASPVAVAFDAPVAAGSALVFVGTALQSTDQAALLGTPLGGGTWGGVLNTRASGDFAPNVCVARAYNVAAGSPSISLPFTVGGSAAAAGMRVTGTLLEIEGVPTSSVIDIAVQTTAAATTSISLSSGTLAQASELLLIIAGGWLSLPTNPTGWTSRLTQQNGLSGFVGAQVSTLVVSSTASVSATVPFDASGPQSAAIMLSFKAAAAVTYKYVFDFAASELPSAETGIEALIARNVEPMSSGAAYEYYSGLTANSGTKAGDATTRQIEITAVPGTVTAGDTIRGSFRKSGGTTKGSTAWITGAVVAV